ncbi:camp-dependent protein kinase regulatory subunit [Auriscalpium vulgare]|uniref:Camp-dependent protein kinase regulatory subunit n=1 Tax=Auriscalpium vulgare TaxID=40419 RepID=A0ACB8SAY4_9AGAM|nr:camp-dependent protein kinase regulatory subunit [Auriscalpium vulgare]
MSTFDALVAELTRDAHRVQPKDVLQFCANWFQSRLEEQRTRTRDALASRPSFVGTIPHDHYVDTPLSASSIPATASPFTDPFEPRRTSLQNPRAQSAFGTLNVAGNALLSSDSMPDPTSTVPHPTFRFDNSLQSIDPGFVDPSFSFDSVTPSQSPGPGDYLHPPGFNILERRTSVSAEPISVDSESHEPLPVFPKTDDQLRRIKASIKDNFLFRDLDEEQETGVLNAMQETHTTGGQVVIRQGDLGDFFYVVESGLLHVFIRKDPAPGWANSSRTPPVPAWQEQDPSLHAEFGKLVQECKPGSSFGELALMYGHPRAATVVAIESSTLWSLDRITFRTIILKAAHRRRTMYEHFLSTVPLLSSLSATERSKIADALVSTVYRDGEAVVRQGEMGDTFFFVEEGEATVTKTHEGDDGELVVGHLTRGDYFGELSLLKSAPRAATVSAIQRGAGSTLPKLKVAALDAQAFTRLLGPLREIMERNAGTYGNYGSPYSH